MQIPGWTSTYCNYSRWFARLTASVSVLHNLLHMHKDEAAHKPASKLSRSGGISSFFHVPSWYGWRAAAYVMDWCERGEIWDQCQGLICFVAIIADGADLCAVYAGCLPTCHVCRLSRSIDLSRRWTLASSKKLNGRHVMRFLTRTAERGVGFWQKLNPHRMVKGYKWVNQWWRIQVELHLPMSLTAANRPTANSEVMPSCDKSGSILSGSCHGKAVEFQSSRMQVSEGDSEPLKELFAEWLSVLWYQLGPSWDRDQYTIVQCSIVLWTNFQRQIRWEWWWHVFNTRSGCSRCQSHQWQDISLDIPDISWDIIIRIHKGETSEQVTFNSAPNMLGKPWLPFSRTSPLLECHCGCQQWVSPAVPHPLVSGVWFGTLWNDISTN